MKISRQALGIGGAAMLFLAVFAPLVSLPFVGSINYFQNDKGDGVIVMVLAVSVLALAAFRRFRAMLIPAALSLILVVVTFVDIQMKIADLHAKLNTDLAGNPFKSLGDVALASVHMQ
jgi:hypothetical protein